MREFYSGNGTEEDIEEDESLKRLRVELGADKKYGREFPLDEFEKGVEEELNDILLSEAEKLGVDFDRHFFSSGQIHLLDEATFVSVTGLRESDAVHRAEDDSVLINWGKVRSN